MSATRYEILLRLTYNDGTEVDPEKFLITKRELTEQFGAAAVDCQPLRYIWKHSSTAHEDAVLKFIVDIDPDPAQTAAFFAELKRTLKERFDHLDMWTVGPCTPRVRSDYERFQTGESLFAHEVERLQDWLDEKCSNEPENRQYFLDRVRLRETYRQRELDASERFRGNAWDYD